MSYWTLGGYDIKVEKDTGDKTTPRIDLFNPLASTLTTHVHFSGTEAKKRTITGVLFENYETEFLGLVDGTAKALVSDQGAQGTYLILSVKPTRLQDSRTLPVVRVDVELIKIS